MSRPIAVHRCRFVDYSPSPITALAFPPLPLPSLKGKRRERDSKDKFGTLGVGHANGNIDLLEWTGEEGEIQVSQAWQVRKVSTFASLFNTIMIEVTYRLFQAHAHQK
jgi:U3 small nucleolar RNA-associated protein 4